MQLSKRRLLIPLLALSLSACTQVTPLDGQPSVSPSVSPTPVSSPQPSGSPAATAGPTASPRPTTAVPAPLVLRLQADAALAAFTTQQSSGFQLCLGQIASARHQLSFSGSLSETARAALLASGASIETSAGITNVSLSSSLDLEALLTGIELKLDNLPSGPISGRTVFLDFTGAELGFVTWDVELAATGGTVSVLLRPAGPVNPAETCPQVEAVLSGARLLGSGGRVRASAERLPIPGSPQNLEVVERSTNYLILKWVFGSDVRSHKLYLDGQEVAANYVTPDYYRFEGLQPDTTYRLGVRSLNLSGQSEIVSISAATTASGRTASGNFSGGRSTGGRPRIEDIVPGDPFRVNSNTSMGQYTPEIAMDDEGNYVIFWAETPNNFNTLTSGDGIELHGQRFDRNHRPLGEEYMIPTNNMSFGLFPAPATAMDSDGNFVVAWHDNMGPFSAIMAQRYDSNGDAIGSQFQVNDMIFGMMNSAPDVAMDDDGNFVVTWTAAGGIQTPGVYARYFDTDSFVTGSLHDDFSTSQVIGSEFIGSQFLVSTSTGPLFPSSVAMDGDGDFVVSWGTFDMDQNPDLNTVYARRYESGYDQPKDPDPVVISEDRPSMTMSVFLGAKPIDVAMDHDGNYVVAWATGPDFQAADVGPDFRVDFKARRFDADGDPRGQATDVGFFESTIPMGAISTSVAMNDDGDFVVTWGAGSINEENGVYGQAFLAGGATIGNEFGVATLTSGLQADPTVAMNREGDFVITWHGYEDPQEMDFDIFARPYERRSASDN